MMTGSIFVLRRDVEIQGLFLRFRLIEESFLFNNAKTLMLSVKLEG